MKKRVLILAMAAFMVTASSDYTISIVHAEEASELPVKALTPKAMDVNPYMAASDSNIHHDCYNTDSTDEVLPVDIYSEINVSYEKVNPNASPAVFFDSYGHSVVPLLGGLAIRDINADEAQTLGYFSPKQHDNGSYLIQSSYSFVDESNRIVCPTNDNRVLMLKATDEEGNVLPEFEKVLDIDIKAAAEAALGKTLDQNLLSVVFDYEGNLWFATGGFRIYPDRKQQGTFGYVSRAAIDKILNGEDVDLSDAVFVYELEPGEGAENGIAASKEGAVILTNLKCYLLQADNGVKKVWETSYKSVGAKESKEGDETTGGGLAWGGGCSPSLTKDLVMFTDNQDPVNLIAVDMKTGEQQPMLEQQQDMNLCCQRIIRYKNRLFYVPSYRNPIMEYHCDTKQWKFHDQCMDVLLEKAKEKEWAQKAANRELGITSDACGSGEYLWIAAPYTNQLLRFSMADSTYTFFTAGEEDTGYSGMAVDKDCIWLAEVKTRDVVRWDIRTGETRRFRVSGRLSARKWRYDELPYATGLLNMGQYLVIIPSFSNGIIRFDKAAGGMTVLAAEFFGQADLEANGYCPQYHGTCSFAKKMDDKTILVQRCRDGKTAAINVEDNTCTAFYPTLSDEDYGKLTKGEDGFEKIEKKYGFFCYESRIFSLGGFMDALAEGKLQAVRSRQMKELETMAANLDGTCGKKVHVHMMRILQGETI